MTESDKDAVERAEAVIDDMKNVPHADGYAVWVPVNGPPFTVGDLRSLARQATEPYVCGDCGKWHKADAPCPSQVAEQVSDDAVERAVNAMREELARQGVSIESHILGCADKDAVRLHGIFDLPSLARAALAEQETTSG